MELTTVFSIKKAAVTFGIIGSLLGVGINYGITKEQVSEIKTEVRENQKINVEQTIAIVEAVTTLRHLSKNMEKLLDK